MIKCGLVKAAGAFGLIICGHARRDKRGCAPPVSSTWTVAGGLWAWHHPCQLLGVGDCGRHRGAVPHRATSACHEPLCHGCCCSQASGNQTNKNKQRCINGPNTLHCGFSYVPQTKNLEAMQSVVAHWRRRWWVHKEI